MRVIYMVVQVINGLEEALEFGTMAILPAKQRLFVHIELVVVKVMSIESMPLFHQVVGFILAEHATTRE
jgi:hypothetical protein